MSLKVTTFLFYLSILYILVDNSLFLNFKELYFGVKKLLNYYYYLFDLLLNSIPDLLLNLLVLENPLS